MIFSASPQSANCLICIPKKVDIYLLTPIDDCFEKTSGRASVSEVQVSKFTFAWLGDAFWRGLFCGARVLETMGSPNTLKKPMFFEVCFNAVPLEILASSLSEIMVWQEAPLNSSRFLIVFKIRTRF